MLQFSNLMPSLTSLAELSRTHCILICTFLVPVNLIATLQTLILTGSGQSQAQISRSVAFACLPALIMIAHVFSWLSIGVVMAPTYILLGLGTICLGLNLWAIAGSSLLVHILHWFWSLLRSFARYFIPEILKQPNLE